MDAVKKLLAVVVIAFIAFPVVVKYWPKPASPERAKAAFEAAGMTVEDYAPTDSPGLGAIDGANMTVDGIMVTIYHFDNEGKIATQIEYQKKDAGTAIVETFNLAQQLGAAQPKQTPSAAARRGMYMIVATGEDEGAVQRIVDIYRRF